MPTPNPQALEFLQTRRSRPAKTLDGPVPNEATLMELLRAAARTPDHGKLEPWRFIVIDRAAMAPLAELAQQRGEALQLEPEQITKGRAQFDQGHLAVAVIEVQNLALPRMNVSQASSTSAPRKALRLNAPAPTSKQSPHGYRRDLQSLWSGAGTA